MSITNSSTVRLVNASVSPDVSGFRKLTFDVLNACRPPSNPRNTNTPKESRTTARRRRSRLNNMRGL